ncbi:Glycerate 2-kinase [Dyadobacter sp. CECT 9275]|uniref:Glycerate 2-kinase n=1 Tax=Dyadobacter helix TaxID=2822344 RepID=A0A916J955_9BACT|nr:glycerate kinase [Dyadobacter sp. CECT 9275]CAG4991917.1 Glycerate 2-kinase [Dyadobacter sp. CECT 9275]
MNLLIAPDKFRGSLDAAEVIEAASEGALAALPSIRISSVPLADGGEGTMEILTQQAQGEYVSVGVQDPLGRAIVASYGFSAITETAFIEMAAASGLSLLRKSEQDPMRTSTFGTGQLILDALDKKAKKILLGIGGSATTDGGIGMAAALGYQFLDENGQILDPVGAALNKIKKFDTTQVDRRIFDTSFVIACDVTNPLYGKSGAAFVYGPQKGAGPETVVVLDNGLINLAEVACTTFGNDVSNFPGAGAAGGLGAGCMWFLRGVLREGVGIVMEQCDMATLIQQADLVITGEGKVDEQTLQGKVVKGLAALCQQHEVPLAVLCGTLLISPEQARDAGITYALSVINRPMDLDTAQNEAHALVRDATFHLVSLFSTISGK